MHLGELLGPRVWNHGECEVGVIVRNCLHVRGIIHDLLFRLLGGGQQVLELLSLLLGEVLVQGTQEVDGVGGVIILGGRVQLVSSSSHEEVRKERSIVLDLLGELDGGIDFTGVTVIADRKVLLLHHKYAILGLERGHHN